MDKAIYDFKGAEVRVVIQNNEPWFVAADVCRVLAHTNPSVAVRRLATDERMTLNITDGRSGRRGGAQVCTIINESGLYSLILTSNKPEAKRFKKWITSEVLPSIRKHGGYFSGQDKLRTGEMNAAEFLRRASKMAEDFIAEVEQKRASKADARQIPFTGQRDGTDVCHGLGPVGDVP